MDRFVANVYLFLAVVAWAVSYAVGYLPWLVWTGTTLLLAGNMYGHVVINERKRK